jgi:hypothetical protein
MKQEMKQDWRGPINEILYGLIFTREITDEIVNGCADAAVQYTVLGLGPEAYYQAIGEALASGEELDSLHQLPQFDHAQVVGFLGAVAKRLDELRPWPEPKYRRLDPTSWATFRDAVPIARLDASILRVRNIVRGVFEPAGDAHPGQYVLMLRLATGETVALLGSYARGEKISLLTDATGDPAEVIEHFTAATGFPADKITPI